MQDSKKKEGRLQQGHRIVRNIKYEKLHFVLLTFNQRLSHIVHVLCDALVNLQTLTMIFFFSLSLFLPHQRNLEVEFSRLC